MRRVLSGQAPAAVDQSVNVCPRTVRRWLIRFRHELAASLVPIAVTAPLAGRDRAARCQIAAPALDRVADRKAPYRDISIAYWPRRSLSQLVAPCRQKGRPRLPAHQPPPQQLILKLCACYLRETGSTIPSRSMALTSEPLGSLLRSKVLPATWIEPETFGLPATIMRTSCQRASPTLAVFLACALVLVVPLMANAVDLCEGKRPADAQAAFECGLQDYLVEGPERDAAAAARWFGEAAALGHTGALNNLGQMHLAGDGVPKDLQKGITLLEKAAQLGYSKAMYSLGVIYEDGRGVPANPSKAADWYERAAIEGHAQAQNIVASLYRFGQGRPQDSVKAADLYRASAEQGNAIAAYNLGALHADGEGVPQDDIEAWKWLLIARGLGDPSVQLMAEETLALLGERMSPAKLDEAVARIRAWRPKRPSANQQ